MRKAVIISGYLHELSDNILPFLDKNTDLYVHTWKGNGNDRWIKKLNRYKKYVNSLNVRAELLIYEKKLYSYFFSTYRVVNMIENIDQYDRIIKFKPNIEGEIPYVGDIDHYYNKAYIQSRPLLSTTKKEQCIYGTVHYQTLDERIFTTYPLALKKMFHILEERFIERMVNINALCLATYGNNYEGSLFWKEWADSKQVKLIQDIDLRIPNSLKYGNS